MIRYHKGPTGQLKWVARHQTQVEDGHRYLVFTLQCGHEIHFLHDREWIAPSDQEYFLCDQCRRTAGKSEE